MRRATLATLAAVCLTGCMTDREYQLRKQQLANQASHPQTYEPMAFEMKGPVKLELVDGSQLRVRVTAPGQPFREIPIPDGVRSQTELIQHLVNVGAISVLGWKAIDSAKGSTRVINQAPAAEAAP